MTNFLSHWARKARRDVLQMSYRGQAPHLGSSLSCVDLLTFLYHRYLHIHSPEDPTRDRFILSKGHAISALYALLAQRGFFPEQLLETFNLDGSALPEHPTPGCVPGIELATGSLGHGLSVGTGLALSAKIQGQSYRTVVLVSDGECNEGSTWEAALFAPKHHLTHLTVIVDYNKWQATGRTDDILELAPLADKWRAFGWHTLEIDGHSFEKIEQALLAPSPAQKPKAIVAHTIKGKGVSFMEDDNNWHYRIPSTEELAKAFLELPV
jgi:transketolase